MKRFLGMFELTVAEQRVVVFLLLALVVFATWKTRRAPAEPDAVTAPISASADQPSPSPGIGP